MPLKPFILALAFLPLASLTTFASDQIRCKEDGAQQELNACARDAFMRADKELNRVYQALIRKEAKEQVFVAKLREAQKAWIAFRDAELAARFACANEDIQICWGSMYPLSYFASKAELTRDRTRQLQRMLKEGYGHGG